MEFYRKPVSLALRKNRNAEDFDLLRVSGRNRHRVLLTLFVTLYVFIKSIRLLDMAFGKGKKKLFKVKKGCKRFTDSDKLVHKHVMEKMIGRPLTKKEKVHHKDGDKKNNRRSNFQLFKSQKEHHEHHKKQKEKTGKW